MPCRSEAEGGQCSGAVSLGRHQMLNCGPLKHLGLRFWRVLDTGCTLLGSSLHFWFTEISVIENSEPGDEERKKTISSCT